MNTTTPFPGPRPYQQDEADQFWGRDHFVKQISRYLHHERLAILSSSSGTGKSSLIQAGIIPYLQQYSQALANTPILQLRFTPYQEQAPLLPTEIFRLALLGDQAAYPEIPLEEDSAWLVVKAVLEDHSFGERVLLIFDQFEELFSYPEACVQEFLRQLGDLHAGSIPPNVRKAIKRKRLLEPEACNDGFQQTVDWLNQGLQTHTLIAIEGDSLFQLERLLDHIPEALSRTHELPALKRHDLQQFFQMHLPGQQVEAGWIEEWENATAACRNLRLQIWLQQLKAGSAPDSSLPSLQEYYLQTLANFPSDADRVQALALLEDHLLSPDYQTRAIIKEQTLLQEYPQSVWEPLIKAGIVRPLPSYHFGKAYELSHDCWRKEVAHYHEQRLIALQRQRWLKKAGVITTAAMIFLASLSWLAGKTNWPYGPEAPIRDTIYIQTNNANARYSRDTLNLYDTTKETILIRDTIQIRDTIAIYPSGPCPPPVCVGCDSLNLVIHQLRLRINELQAQLPCPPSAPMLPRSLNPISITFDVSDPFGGGSNKLTFNAYAHIVKTGENLNQIARLLIRPESDSPDDLRQMKQKIVEMNKLASENAIKAGQVILLPMY